MPGFVGFKLYKPLTNLQAQEVAAAALQVLFSTVLPASQLSLSSKKLPHQMQVMPQAYCTLASFSASGLRAHL